MPEQLRALGITGGFGFRAKEINIGYHVLEERCPDTGLNPAFSARAVDRDSGKEDRPRSVRDTGDIGEESSESVAHGSCAFRVRTFRCLKRSVDGDREETSEDSA